MFFALYFVRNQLVFALYFVKNSILFALYSFVSLRSNLASLHYGILQKEWSKAERA